MDAQSQLKNLKTLLSKLTYVADSINVLHDSNVLKNVSIINLDASSSLITRSTKFCEQAVSVENLKCGVNFALNGNRIDSLNAWRNEPIKNLDASIISRSTKFCEQSVSVDDSMDCFDSTSHGDGMYTGYQSIKRSAASSYLMYGNGMDSLNASRNDPTVNLDASSAIISRSAKICEQSVSVKNSMDYFDSASHGDRMNSDYETTKCSAVSSYLMCGAGIDNLNAWRHEPTAENLDASSAIISRSTNFCEQSVSVDDSMDGFDSTSHGDGMYTGYQNTKRSAVSSYLMCGAGIDNLNAWRNEPTAENLDASSAIISRSTNFCEQSVSVDDSMDGFDSTSHGDGMYTGYQSMPIDRETILPIKFSVNSAALSDSMYGFDFASNRYGMDSICWNGNTQEEDRHHLVNYLNYLPMFADQVTKGDLNAADNGVNSFEVNINTPTDVNAHLHDSNVIGDQRVKFDTNVTFEEGTKLDENERNRLTESMITKPKPMRGCDNSFMFVKTSDDKSPKKLCCPFCEKLYSKLPVHLETKHNDEPDVRRFLSFSKGSKQRRLILDSLRKTGLLIWNKKAELNKLELIPSRRPNPKFGNDADRFINCPYCSGIYAKSSLRLHVKYCPRKPTVNDDKTKGKRFITALATSVEARYHENASKALQNVYKRFRNDQVVRSLKFDWLITVYGNKLSAKNTRLKSPAMIRGRLRQITRFLHELKRIAPEVTDLATLYHPKYYDQVLEAIRAMAHFNYDTNEYRAPCTATSCVTALKQIGVMLKAEYIKRGDHESKLLTEDFLIVFNGDVHDMINKTANENESKRRRRRRVILPSLDDLKLLNQYIQAESNNCYNELSKSFDYKKWVYLSKLTMISILIFNRKRVGDTEDITLEDFEFKETINEKTNQQLFASLSDEAKQVARCYSRLHVRGKKNRTVPVLLNQYMQNNLNLLTSHRDAAGISPKNEYLFALPPSPIEECIVINAGVTLKKFAELSGAENPSCINGTNLRKQLATMLVSLKLDDAEVADVADFMGHAELVHRNNYRQNTIDRQVVKMSQWLEAALGNVVSIDTERKLNDENQQKATKLLNRLISALDNEESSDDFRSVATQKRKNSSHVTMKSKLRHPSALKRKNSSDVTMKSKRACVRGKA